MPKYIAIDRTHQARSPLTGQYSNTSTSIVAIFDCRSHKRATAIASAALEIPRLSVQLYSSLSAAERAWADNARALDVPEEDRPTGTPVGSVKKGVILKISTCVSPEIAERFKSIEGKSGWIADAIERKLKISQNSTNTP
jgi:hypothetical protein